MCEGRRAALPFPRGATFEESGVRGKAASLDARKLQICGNLYGMVDPGTIYLIFGSLMVAVRAIKLLLSTDPQEERRHKSQAAYQAAKAAGKQKIEALKQQEPLSHFQEYVALALNEISAALLAIQTYQSLGGSTEAVDELIQETTKVMGQLSEVLESDSSLRMIEGVAIQSLPAIEAHPDAKPPGTDAEAAKA